MKKEMNLTVLIACKNRPINIAFCLASIATCKPRPKTILIDFGSTVPLEFPEYNDWLKIVRVDRNISFFHKARALNIGIKQVQTKFLCITDADQIFQANFFGVVYKHLLKNPKLFVMCYTHWLRKVPNIGMNDLRKNYPLLLKEAKESGIRPHGDGCCNGVLTKWIKHVHGLDENYVGYGAEDSDLALRAKFDGLKVKWVHKETTMIHLPHPKTGKYYSKEIFTKNKQRFYKRRVTKEIIVNKKGKWGLL